ncbi:MAG: ankyrin repeat domain-containing protein [Rhodobacteraceae bacterium]|nr:ankyrin repeat domain-containing protein [Paracoccaceae bacterium]
MKKLLASTAIAIAVATGGYAQRDCTYWDILPFYLGATADDVGTCLAAGANIEARDPLMGWTPLHHAAFASTLEAVQVLIQAGANVEARTNDGETPLHKAAWFGRPNIAAALLDAGADPDARDEKGYTPLHFAATLMELHFPGMTRDEVMGWMPGKAGTARLLLNAGANPKARDDEYGAQPADLAAHTLMQNHAVSRELHIARSD